MPHADASQPQPSLRAQVDAMVVIGGRNSANTQRLAETCAALVETYLVETAEELDVSLLRGKPRLGLTAGASTPDSSIEQVEARSADSSSSGFPGVSRQ